MGIQETGAAKAARSDSLGGGLGGGLGERAAKAAHSDSLGGGHEISERAALAAPPPAPYFHKSLRHPNINYRSGWWAVTIQVAKNKSMLGAIVGRQVALNALGRAVHEHWLALPAKYPELELHEFVVMPNHFHALFHIHFLPTNREHHLSHLISRFKGGTSFLYGKMRRAGEVEDIGERLWQRDYWDDLVTSGEEFEGWRKYIIENPAHWSSDRYGACTEYLQGNAELLNHPRIAFVASQGFYASELRPKRVWAAGAGGSEGGGAGERAAKAARSDSLGGGAGGDLGERAAKAARSDSLGGGAGGDLGERAAKAARSDSLGGGGEEANTSNIGVCGFSRTSGISRTSGLSRTSGFSRIPVLISTFTSAQEREALRRALAKKRPLIVVFPAGIPTESCLAAGLADAIREGWALAVSPQAPGSRLNKKIATWCNEFVLKNADEIWVGDLAQNGMLAQMLAGLGRARVGAWVKGG